MILLGLKSRSFCLDILTFSYSENFKIKYIGQYSDLPCMHSVPMLASIPCSHTPIQGACVSSGGPGPMHSFSDVSEKLLQIRYITQSVVCDMM